MGDEEDIREEIDQKRQQNAAEKKMPSSKKRTADR